MRSELFRDESLPPSTSRRFYPKKTDIVHHMYIAAMKTRFTKLDQENLALKIKVWEKQYPSSKIFFRGYGNVTEENNQEYDKADTESHFR